MLKSLTIFFCFSFTLFIQAQPNRNTKWLYGISLDVKPLIAHNLKFIPRSLNDSKFNSQNVTWTKNNVPLQERRFDKFSWGVNTGIVSKLGKHMYMTNQLGYGIVGFANRTPYPDLSVYSEHGPISVTVDLEQLRWQWLDYAVLLTIEKPIGKNKILLTHGFGNRWTLGLSKRKRETAFGIYEIDYPRQSSIVAKTFFSSTGLFFEHLKNKYLDFRIGIVYTSFIGPVSQQNQPNVYETYVPLPFRQIALTYGINLVR